MNSTSLHGKQCAFPKAKNVGQRTQCQYSLAVQKKRASIQWQWYFDCRWRTKREEKSTLGIDIFVVEKLLALHLATPYFPHATYAWPHACRIALHNYLHCFLRSPTPRIKKKKKPSTTDCRRSAVDGTANWRQWWNTLNGSTRILISAMNIVYYVNNFTVLFLSEDTLVIKVTRSTTELVLVNSQSE